MKGVGGELAYYDASRPNSVRFVRSSDGKVHIEVEGKHDGARVFHHIEVDYAMFANTMKGWLA